MKFLYRVRQNWLPGIGSVLALLAAIALIGPAASGSAVIEYQASQLSTVDYGGSLSLADGYFSNVAHSALASLAQSAAGNWKGTLSGWNGQYPSLGTMSSFAKGRFQSPGQELIFSDYSSAEGLIYEFSKSYQWTSGVSF